MKHVVEITEYLVKRVVVEADTETEAREKVREAYADDGSITLDYKDFDDATISYVREANNFDLHRYMEI